MVTNKVVPVEECPMCGEYNLTHTDKNICPRDNPDHHICPNCIISLKEKYKKEFCAYCGERPVIINMTVNLNHEGGEGGESGREGGGGGGGGGEGSGNNNRSLFQMCVDKNPIVFRIVAVIVSYVLLIYNWHLYRMINYYMDHGKSLQDKVDWHVYNALYALFIDAVILFTLVNVCEGHKCRFRER